MAEIRSRTLAAAALADRAPDAAAKVMEQTVRRWWEETIVPALKEGRPVIRREDAWALYEILHVVRDNLNHRSARLRAPLLQELPASIT